MKSRRIFVIPFLLVGLNENVLFAVFVVEVVVVSMSFVFCSCSCRANFVVRFTSHLLTLQRLVGVVCSSFAGDAVSTTVCGITVMTGCKGNERTEEVE